MLCAKCLRHTEVKDLYKVKDKKGTSFVCFSCSTDYTVIGKADDYKTKE